MEAITERVTRRLKDQIVVTIIVLLITFLIAYFIELPFSVNTAYLTVATFLFAIFASFFTSRQSSRHDSLRESITQFDGNLSSIYRGSGNFTPELQQEIGGIITKHYEDLLRSRDWTFHIVNPSETISKLHKTLHDHLGDIIQMPEFRRTTLMQMQ